MLFPKQKLSSVIRVMSTVAVLLAGVSIVSSCDERGNGLGDSDGGIGDPNNGDGSANAVSDAKGAGNVTVSSAGTGALDGTPASEGAYLVSLERGPRSRQSNQK